MLMDLKNRLQEQYVNYRDMMKEKDLVEDVRQTIPFMNEVKKAKLHVNGILNCIKKAKKRLKQ
jgi:hypothetical protein